MTPDQLATKADLQQLEIRIAELLIQHIPEGFTPGQRYLRSKDVENMLGISSSTLQNLRDSQAIPFTQLGKTYFYPYQELMDILRNNTTDPTQMDTLINYLHR